MCFNVDDAQASSLHGVVHGVGADAVQVAFILPVLHKPDDDICIKYEVMILLVKNKVSERTCGYRPCTQTALWSQSGTLFLSAPRL